MRFIKFTRRVPGHLATEQALVNLEQIVWAVRDPTRPDTVTLFTEAARIDVICSWDELERLLQVPKTNRLSRRKQ